MIDGQPGINFTVDFSRLYVENLGSKIWDGAFARRSF